MRVCFRRGYALCALAMALTACATRPMGPYDPSLQELAYQTGDASFAGFDLVEAKDAAEFCVEFDNQDDRLQILNALKGPPVPDEARARELRTELDFDSAHIDPARWDPVPVFDSRKAVAEAWDKYRGQSKLPADARIEPQEDDVRPWTKLFKDLEERAEAKHLNDPDAQTVQDDPDLNGFGPWQNAWALYRGVGPNHNRYAIVLRGTVFSNRASAIDDAFFQPVIAHGFVSGAISFSDAPAAAVHSGFAHAAYSTLLDARFGVLQALAANVPAGAQLMIVGHSQGAAVATLIHASLHYSMRDADLGSKDPLGLRGRHYRLKSYVFAQPKPGDFVFAGSFARITQRFDNALVINNSMDVVPQVPLTLQSSSDLSGDFRGNSLLARFVRWISGVGPGVRRTFGVVLEPWARDESAGWGYYYHWEEVRKDLTKSDEISESWNFTHAGHLLWVYGPDPQPPGTDDFYQHHATTYRMLLQQQFSAPRR